MVRFLHGTNQTETSSRASSKGEIIHKDRRNGWTCPWHPLQLIAWFFLCFFATTYFGILVSYLPLEWRPAAYIIPGGLYVVHLVVHVLALSIDPADPHIRVGSSREKNAFDRNLHAHVIENNHCHICEADVFPKSKHCSTCNKCVSDFDHHCKWLNTCVGGRNYKLFVSCIFTAFAGSILMSVVNLYIFIVYFIDKKSLLSTQTGDQFKLFAPVSDTVFVVFVGAIQGLHIIAMGLLGHLLCFHFYLIYMNMSTYEFIVNSRERKQQDDHEARRSREGTPISLKRFRNKVRPTPEGMENGELSVEGEQPEHSSSSEEPVPCETSVKVINEVSSKVAKRNSSLDSPNYQNDMDNAVVYESDKRPSKEHKVSIPESVVSSAESLREIENPDQIPRVDIQKPSEITRPFTSYQTENGGNASQKNIDQSNGAIESNCNQSQPGVSYAASKDSGNFSQPCHGASTSDKNNQLLSDSEGEELVPLNTSTTSYELTKDEVNNSYHEHISTNEVAKKKNRKRDKSRSHMEGKELFELSNETRSTELEMNELPPLVTQGRRPLPSLDSYTNNKNSSC